MLEGRGQEEPELSDEQKSWTARQTAEASNKAPQQVVVARRRHTTPTRNCNS